MESEGLWIIFFVETQCITFLQKSKTNNKKRDEQWKNLIINIASARLQNWDYGRCANYFITICTAHREQYFGTIENGNRTLSEIGLVAEQEWIKTNEIRPDV